MKVTIGGERLYLIPGKGQILCRKVDPQERLEGGIIIPNTLEETKLPIMYKVLEVGEESLNIAGCSIAVGDYVRVKNDHTIKEFGIWIQEVDGESLFYLAADKVLGVMKLRSPEPR